MTEKKSNSYKLQLFERNFPMNIYTQCGDFPIETISTFMHNTASKPVPLSSCVHSIHARYERSYSLEMNADLEDSGITEYSSPRKATISLTMKNCRLCDQSKCHKNIISGKCCDNYVRDTIGAAFFPQFYSKQK